MTIHADEIQRGDVLLYDGCERRIVCVDRRDGWAWPIAIDGSGWAVALDDHLVDVLRSAPGFELAAQSTLDPNVAKRRRAAVV